MGSSASKQSVQEAVDSVKRQINYRPAEADNLSHDLQCLEAAQKQGFTKVAVDKKKTCSGTVNCERHTYKK